MHRHQGFACLPLACLIAGATAGQAAQQESAAPRVTVEHRFPQPADAVWQRLGRFCGIAQWQSLVASCVTEEREDGFYRIVVMKDNSAYTERLEGFSHQEHSFRYSIASGPLPVTGYVSEFRIVPDGAGQSRLIWRAWYDAPTRTDPEKFAAQLEALYRNGIKGMEPLLEARR